MNVLIRLLIECLMMLSHSRKKLCEHFKSYNKIIQQQSPYILKGKLKRIVGMKLEAAGFTAPVGSSCIIKVDETRSVLAEVVGFSEDTIFLMSAENTLGITPGAEVIPLGKIAKVPVSMDLLGRVLDGSGNPLDGQAPIQSNTFYPLIGKLINPLERKPISEPLDVGIRTINGLLTVGRGQRIGLFSGSGVGKSVLIGMMTKYTAADVTVVGLIGERGREVKEFIEQSLGKEGIKKSVVIAAPADTSPLMRINGAMWATTVAEYFRDQGLKVLLILDSLTRFSMAQRELALSIGELPTTKGYPPSVFAKLSQLIERAGNSIDGKGSITAFYTVLAESDDQQDPIVDAARSFLDGHIVLSRKLAEAGIYPAIDVEKSISRCMPSVVSDEHEALTVEFRKLYACYNENRDLVTMGAYKPGVDKLIDRSLLKYPELESYLKQNTKTQASFDKDFSLLKSILLDG